MGKHKERALPRDLSKLPDDAYVTAHDIAAFIGGRGVGKAASLGTVRRWERLGWLARPDIALPGCLKRWRWGRVRRSIQKRERKA